MKSIRQKLTLRNTLNLAVLFSVVFVLLFVVTDRRNRIRLQQTRDRIESGLVEKGRLLVSNSAFLLGVYIEDNSITTVGDMVRNTVNGNQEVLYGGYVRFEDYQPWVWVTPGDPDGVIESELGMRSHTTEWAFSQKRTSHRLTELGGQRVYEFSAPVRLPYSDESDPIAGSIIFGFTSALLDQELAAAEDAYKSESNRLLGAFAMLGALALLLGYLVMRRLAEKITEPIERLTSAANTIAGGEYGTQVKVESEDEIQDLATAFNTMSHDMSITLQDLKTKNTQLQRARNELSDLNRLLEEKVVERTRQLSASENKFRTLFNESADAFVVGDIDRIIDCNPAMLSLVRCPDKNTFMASPVKEYFPKVQADGQKSWVMLQDAYNRAVTEGSQLYEWEMKRHDGTAFMAEAVVTSFPLGDRMVLHGVLRDISERKRTEVALALAQERLIKTAHSSGMAEIATGVLHNIGNIINSVNISVQRLEGTLGGLRFNALIKANELLQSHKDDFASFLTEDEKGRKWPDFMDRLTGFLKEDFIIVREETSDLMAKVDLMRDVIFTQQNYAKSEMYVEITSVRELVDDAIKLQIGALQRQDIEISRMYQAEPRGNAARIKLIHVLTNLIKNALEAMSGNDHLRKPKQLSIGIDRTATGLVEIVVADNGCGIERANIDRIFHHGYTTKPDGHGFGLHTCANFMNEMGGELYVTSDGEGCGATFIMRFPLQDPQEVTSVSRG